MCRKYFRHLSHMFWFNQSLFFPPLLFSFYFLLSGGFDPKTIPLPFHMIVPFDTTTIKGWYTLYLLQFDTCISYSLSVISGTAYFLSCFAYIRAIGDHFKHILEMKCKYDDPKSEANQVLQIKRQLCKAIETHIKGLE